MHAVMPHMLFGLVIKAVVLASRCCFLSISSFSFSLKNLGHPSLLGSIRFFLVKDMAYLLGKESRCCWWKSLGCPKLVSFLTSDLLPRLYRSSSVLQVPVWPQQLSSLYVPEAQGPPFSLQTPHRHEDGTVTAAGRREQRNEPRAASTHLRSKLNNWIQLVFFGPLGT